MHYQETENVPEEIGFLSKPVLGGFMRRQFHTVAALFMGIVASPSSGETINLTNDTSFGTSGGTREVPLSTYLGADLNLYRGAVIDGAILSQAGIGSGSGAYRRLFQLGGESTVNGYNRGVPKQGSEFDESVPGGFDPVVRLSDLVPNNGYYQFTLDINEPGSGTNRYLSIDEAQIWVGGLLDPDPLPNTEAEIPALGTKVWDLQENPIGGSRNDILLDFSINTGSGTDDMHLFVPTDLFVGFDQESFLYLYAKHGQLGEPGGTEGNSYDGFTQDQGGFEEWATFTTDSTSPPAPFVPPISEIPEPSPVIFLLAGLAAVTLVRRRR